jgi:hypothetical protein
MCRREIGGAGNAAALHKSRIVKQDEVTVAI